jgi:hypothetical protein
VHISDIQRNMTKLLRDIPQVGFQNCFRQGNIVSRSAQLDKGTAAPNAHGSFSAHLPKHFTDILATENEGVRFKRL